MIAEETFVALVESDISGPVNVYVALPAPPTEVAVSVIIPPAQNGLLAVELSALSVGCAPTVTEKV